MSLTVATTAFGQRMPAFITPDGVRRFLGVNASTRVAAPLFASANPVIPRSEWKATRRDRGVVPIMNQGQHGACVGHGSCRALMKAREQENLTFVALSPTFIYAQINGGMDNGSTLPDAAETLLKTGTCTMQECGEDTIYASQISSSADATASRFRAGQIYQIRSFDEAVSAWLLGFDVFDTVMVGGDFNYLDKDGVVPVTPGPGNHCVSVADELKRSSGNDWVLEHANSWGTQWGQGGFFFAGEAHYDAQSMWQAFAIKSALLDPQDKDNPPA